MRLSSLFLILFSALFLTACATMNKNECVSADWQMIGYEDGSNGASAGRLQQHREACAKHSVTPDFSQYQAGYDEGLKRFCTDRVGFTKGKSGYRYQGICPANLEVGFLKGYKLGQEFYGLNQKIRSAENSVRIKEQQIADLEAELLALENELLAGGVSAVRTKEILDLTKTKTAELTTLEDDLLDLKLAVASAEGELKQLEDKSPY